MSRTISRFIRLLALLYVLLEGVAKLDTPNVEIQSPSQFPMLAYPFNQSDLTSLSMLSARGPLEPPPSQSKPRLTAGGGGR